MTRGLSASMLSAIAADVVRPCFLAELEFVGSTLYLSSVSRDVSHLSQNFLGNGLFIGLDGIQESLDVDAFGWSVTLQGADSALMSLVLGSVNQSKNGIIYLALLDSNEQSIASPEEIAHGYFDYAEIDDSGSESSIVLNYESELLGLSRIQEFRYTHFSQQALFPNDFGFQYAAQAEDWNGFWGKSGKAPKPQRKRKKGRN